MSRRTPGSVVLLLCLVVLGLSLPVFAIDHDEGLSDRPPADIRYLAMRAIPEAVYTDQPDSLLIWLNTWEDAAGAVDPVVRMRILGAIWDGQFNEDLYDQRIIDQLVDYCTRSFSPSASPALSPDLAAEVITGKAPSFARVQQDFDGFSRAFADQLLPHVPLGGPEEFFCLMYSGRTQQAWDLLASDELNNTWLWSYRERKLSQLQEVLPTFVALEGGLWSPFGKYAFAGDHALVGAQFGVRKGPWLMRMVAEVRLGRTERGYLARNKDVIGVSDRFNAVLVGLELGRSFPLWSRLSLESFGGVGMDGVKPLKDHDLLLNALHLDAGAGIHYDLGAHRQWFLAITGRREWTRPRNKDGTALWGDAWSVRLAVGWNLGHRGQETLRVIQP